MKLNSIVSVKWLSENFDNPDLIILDASPKENKSNLETEFKNLQIKGARCFDMESTFLDKDSQFPNMIPSPIQFTIDCQELGISKNSMIIVYDNLGIYTSPRAWWMFKLMGHKNIAVLDGGLSAWKKENFLCETKKNKIYKKGDFVAVINQNLVKSAQDILKNIDSEEMLVLDARSKDRFDGLVPEPRENMSSGHIPNSINIPFQDVLNDGIMKSKSELTEIFKFIELTNQPLIFSCGSGITACIILLATDLILDNQKFLYDGSWSEWGYLGKYPVEKLNI